MLIFTFSHPSHLPPSIFHMPILDRMDQQYANLPMSLRLLLLIVRLLQVSIKVSSCGSSIDWQPGKGMWTLGGCIPKFGGWRGKRQS